MDFDSTLGTVYITIGAFGITENLLTAFLINGSKDMQNPTYSYIVQSCICDAIVLSMIAVFAGVLLIFPVLMTMPVCRVGGYIVTLGWYPSCLFMVLTAVTRWLQLEYPQKLKTYFTKRFITLTIFASYLMIACVCSVLLIVEPAPVFLYNVTYSWAFDRTNINGDALAITNIVFNAVCAVLVAAVNAKSCWHIHRTRLQVMNVSTQRNRQREIRLFVQCAITGAIYIIAAGDFFVSSSLKNPGLVEYLISNFVWICHHVQQPIVYMILNAGLRRAFVQQLLMRSVCGRRLVDKFFPTTVGDRLLSIDGGPSVTRLNKYSDAYPQQTVW